MLVFLPYFQHFDLKFIINLHLLISFFQFPYIYLDHFYVSLNHVNFFVLKLKIFTIGLQLVSSFSFLTNFEIKKVVFLNPF